MEHSAGGVRTVSAILVEARYTVGYSTRTSSDDFIISYFGLRLVLYSRSIFSLLRTYDSSVSILQGSAERKKHTPK